MNHVAILGPGRTGSTLLFDILRRMKEFAPTHKGEKEFLNYKFLPDQLIESRFVDLKKFLQQNSDKIVITHVKVAIKPRIDDRVVSIEELIEKLMNIGFNKFILLRRDNVFRQTLSSHRSLKNVAQWHSRVKGSLGNTTRKIRIDPKHYLQSVTLQKEFQAKLRNTLSKMNLDHLELVYEQDILKNYKIALAKICRFTMNDAQFRSIPTAKLTITNPFPVKQCIKNFTETQKVFQGTPYEWMIRQ